MYENLSPEQRKQLNELLSMTTIKSDGAIDGQPNPTLANLMGPQANPQYQETPMPQNYFQRGNNAPVDLGQSQPQFAGQNLDYSSAPVEYGGVKAYRLKGDPLTAVTHDGQIIRMGVDDRATRARRLADAEIAKRELEVQGMRARPETTYDKEFAKRKAEADAVNLMANTPGTTEWKSVKKQEADEAKKSNAEKATIEGLVSKGKLLLGNEKSEGAIDKAMKQADSWSATGLTGQVLRNIGGTDAFKLEQTINPIKANLGFDELAKMRAASPTGGALGQVAVKELEFLQSAVASLDTAQDAEQLKQNLQAVKTHYNNWITNQIAAKQAGAIQDQPKGAPVPVRSEAEANTLPKGTVVIINGRRAVVE